MQSRLFTQEPDVVKSTRAEPWGCARIRSAGSALHALLMDGQGFRCETYLMSNYFGATHQPLTHRTIIGAAQERLHWCRPMLVTIWRICNESRCGRNFGFEIRHLTLATQSAVESDRAAPKPESDSALNARNRPGPSLSRSSDDQHQKRASRTKTAFTSLSSARRGGRKKDW